MEFFTKDDMNVMISSSMISPFKILHHRFDKLTNFGNTKMGTHCSLTVDIEDVDIGQRSLSFFAKFIPENEEYKAFVKANNSFGKEVYFYSHIASVMEPLLPSEMPLPVPRCHFSRAGNMESSESQSNSSFEASVIILQDLFPLGYVPMKIWLPLDLSHCRVVMRALAVFHGGSVLLQNSNTENAEYAEVNEAIISMKETVFILDEGTISNNILHAVAETTASVICHLWPNKYPCGQFYRRIQGILWNSYRNICTMLRPTDTQLSVLCHGELCGNNILFAYDNEQQGEQTPVDVKFVDMQCLRYAPPITDILIFLHVCTERSFRHRHLTELLSYYQIEFARTVSPNVANKTLNLEELQMCTRDMQELGLVAAIHLLPVCLAHSRARSLATSIHRGKEFNSRISSMIGRRDTFSFGRYSLNDPVSEQLENVYKLQENQSERILEGMRASQQFRTRLEEAYIEYLEFVGLWENPPPGQVK